jgi:hypothetical protein
MTETPPNIDSPYNLTHLLNCDLTTLEKEIKNIRFFEVDCKASTSPRLLEAISIIESLQQVIYSLIHKLQIKQSYFQKEFDQLVEQARMVNIDLPRVKDAVSSYTKNLSFEFGEITYTIPHKIINLNQGDIDYILSNDKRYLVGRGDHRIRSHQNLISLFEQYAVYLSQKEGIRINFDKSKFPLEISIILEFFKELWSRIKSFTADLIGTWNWEYIYFLIDQLGDLKVKLSIEGGIIKGVRYKEYELRFLKDIAKPKYNIILIHDITAPVPKSDLMQEIIDYLEDYERTHIYRS